MPLLGDVFLNTVYEDSPNQGINTTAHPVEDGEDIIDHISKRPTTMSITGVVVGADAGQRKDKLEKYMNSGELLKYTYRTKLENVIIESFIPTYDVDVANGFKFDIALVQVRIAKAAVLANLSKPVKKQVAPVANKGRQQKVVKTKRTFPQGLKGGDGTAGGNNREITRMGT